MELLVVSSINGGEAGMSPVALVVGAGGAERLS